MAFTLDDFRAFANALYAHPEWREELRRLVLTEELLELPEVVRRLADSVRELAEAQRRTEQRLDAVEQRLDAVEQRLDGVEQRLDGVEQRLDAVEQRLDGVEQRLDSLDQRVDNLGKAFGAFQRAFGSTVEEEAASVIEVVLRRKGYRALRPAYSLAIDGEGEIDVILPLEDPEGRPVWAVVEAKARLSRRDIQAWAQRMRSPDRHRQLAERGCPGPYLVYAYSIRMDLGAQEQAEADGIGLLKSDGEVLSPREPIAPA